jgi:hypothetical protein
MLPPKKAEARQSRLKNNSCVSFLSFFYHSGHATALSGIPNTTSDDRRPINGNSWRARKGRLAALARDWMSKRSKHHINPTVPSHGYGA